MKIQTYGRDGNVEHNKAYTGISMLFNINRKENDAA